jgi:uncharacterized protein YeaO (DUF488 family)
VRRRARIRLKRVYDEPSPRDGMRVLVDGLWPRGLSREAVAADLWLREAAPSAGLRRWYGHDPRRWRRFREKYRAELSRRPEVLAMLRDLSRRTSVTLLFGAADPLRNNAAALRDFLEGDSR